MKLTKNEIVKYVTIVLIISCIPYLYQFILLIVAFMPRLDYSMRIFSKYNSQIEWICFFITRIITAFYIHLSEKRIGNNVNIIWQLFGLIFGFTGFVGYSLWGLLIKSDLFLDEVELDTLQEKP